MRGIAKDTLKGVFCLLNDKLCNMVLALSIFLGLLSVANKVLLLLNRKSGWLSGMAIGLISGFYFWFIGLKILAIAELGFFIVMLYGYLRRERPSLRQTFKINLILSGLTLLLCYFLFVGALTAVETLSSLSFIWGGYLLAIDKKVWGWLLLLLAHAATAIASFYAGQTLFTGLQTVSGLVCAYAASISSRSKFL
jgi:hypothetical protein